MSTPWKTNFKNILFLDIETVSAVSSYSELSEDFRQLWRKKCAQFDKDHASLEDGRIGEYYTQKAGIFAEFAKIVCISVGYVNEKNEAHIKSFAGHDEAALLNEFSLLLQKYFNKPEQNFLAGHNIKEFDIPFLCRRMVIHGLELPALLDISGKKPWQLEYLLDTMDMWRFGDYKNFTSLQLLAAVLGIPSPKDDIDGSMVGNVYWSEDGLDRIAAYCERDVLTVIKILAKYAQRDTEDMQVIVK